MTLQVDPTAFDAFTLANMIAAVNRLKYVPNVVGSLGLFEPMPLTTRTALIDLRDQVLSISDPVAIGTTGNTQTDEYARQAAVVVPHYKEVDTLLAQSLSGAREFGTNTLKTVADVRDRKLAKMRTKIEFAWELARVRAVTKGVITNSKGVVIVDFQDAFKATKPAAVTFDPYTATGSGSVRGFFSAQARNLRKILGVMPTEIVALCGATFFDRIINSEEVRSTYLNQISASELRAGYVNGPAGTDAEGIAMPGSLTQFVYANIRFVEYTGELPGGADIIDHASCYLVPRGVPDMYVEALAPSDYMEDVGAAGIPFYAKAEALSMNRGWTMEVQSNFLPVNTRPDAIIEITAGNVTGLN